MLRKSEGSPGASHFECMHIVVRPRKKNKRLRQPLSKQLSLSSPSPILDTSFSFLFHPLLPIPSKLFHPPTLHSSSSSSATSSLPPNLTTILSPALLRARTPPLVPTIHYGTKWQALLDHLHPFSSTPSSLFCRFGL